MRLVWKLLRQHISIGQFAGFFFANLCGMFIVLFGYQFYEDVLPVFTQQDSFMKADYLVISKRIGTGSTNTFTDAELQELRQQKFANRVGRFTSTEYKADATMGVQGTTVLNSEMFFESVPDEFIDVPLSDWKYTPGAKEVPIIIPRTYINMYNFGFAQSHSMPKISDGLTSMIDFTIFVHSGDKTEKFKGKVIGFSSRMSSILVPQAFMDWSNNEFAPQNHTDANRLILEVGNPADEGVTKYLDKHGYEVEKDKLDAEKLTQFLRLIVIIVMGIGVIISALSFYILMLSIYLLVQKNSEKLENLLLIGYSPTTVALPYQMLTAILNVFVLALAVVGLMFMRNYYLDYIYAFYPELQAGGFAPALGLGLIIFVLVTMLNFIVIRRKIVKIWQRKD